MKWNEIITMLLRLWELGIDSISFMLLLPLRRVSRRTVFAENDSVRQLTWDVMYEEKVIYTVFGRNSFAY